MPFLMNQSGVVESVPDADVEFLRARGWSEATPEALSAYQGELLKKANEEKYSTPGQYLKTTGESVARGLTFGGSDWIENKIADNGSEIKAREEAHPVLSFAGEAVGMALPALIPGVGEAGIAGNAAKGAGVASKAAKAYDAIKAGLSLTPAGVGATAERVVTKALTRELPETAGLLQRVTERALAEGAGQVPIGVEMALGHALHENAIGNPDYTAEALLANPGKIASDVGESVLFNAALRGLIVGGGKLAGAGIGRIQKELTGDSMKDLLLAAEGHANLNATNARPGEIKRIFTQKGEESASKIGVEARELGILKNPVADSPDNILERAAKVKEESGRKIGEVLKNADEKIAASNPPNVLSAANTNPVGRTTWERLDAEIREPITKALMSEGSTVAIAEQFNKVLDRYGVAYAGKELGLAELGRLKRDIGDFIYKNGKVLDPWAKEINTPLKRVYDHIDDLVFAGVKDALGHEGVSTLKAANRGFEVAATMERLAEKGIERSAENNAVHLTGTLGALAGFTSSGLSGAAIGGSMLEAVRRRGASAVGYTASFLRSQLEPKAALLGALAKNNQTLGDVIASDLRAVFTHPEAVASAAKIPAAAMLAKADQTADERSKEFARRAAEIRQAANPNVLEERLSQLAADWQQHAPQTSMAVGMTATKAISFLSSKLPQPPDVATSQLVGRQSDWQPSPGQMERFGRYYTATLDPRSILKSVASGTLTAEEVEAVKVVYPNLYRQMQQATLESLNRSKGVVPRTVRNSVDLLMGAPISRSAMAIQAVYAKAATKPQQQAPKAGTKKPPENASSRMSLHPSPENG